MIEARSSQNTSIKLEIKQLAQAWISVREKLAGTCNVGSQSEDWILGRGQSQSE